MAILIVPEKKWCPKCFFTCKTDATHCPESANYPIVHEFKFVPLEVCKPDTSNMHKVERSLHHEPYQTDPERLKKIAKKRAKQQNFVPIANVPISRIREFQRKAKFPFQQIVKEG